MGTHCSRSFTMAQERICLALLFAFLVQIVLANGRENRLNYSNVDLAKFLTDSPNVWVLKTTEPGNVTCRHDAYGKITDNKTTFTRFFVNNTSTNIKKLEGKLLVWESADKPAPGKFDAIEINDTVKKREYPLSEEVYEFQSNDRSCAVVAVLDNSLETTSAWLDLRVSTSTIESHPGQQCEAEFQRVLSYYPERKERKQKWRMSYTSDCKNLLKKTS
uniref:Putative lipocalin-3 1 n=1 Tax=Amblyomma americanum TaxID=6943 RepID=A0A0C9S5C6_AMBAM